MPWCSRGITAAILLALCGGSVGEEWVARMVKKHQAIHVRPDAPQAQEKGRNICGLEATEWRCLGRLLPKQWVAGSNPVSRSITFEPRPAAAWVSCRARHEGN